ncbi:MAG TPA: hypothetical protein VF422_04110 [Dokdonella sp.]
MLTLANGDTLVVKERLNRGEEADYIERMRGVRTRAAICIVVAYLLDWTLKDTQPKIYGLSDDDKEKVLNNLDPDDFEEIRIAIFQHEKRVQQARDAAKKAAAGETESSATSPSPSTTAGPTTPSTDSIQTSTT